MRPHITPVISTLDALVQALPTSFIVFVGSAISGVRAPFLPMVDQLKRQVLLDCVRIARKDDYGSELVQDYAQALLDGRLRGYLQTTKFEEFLWHIERIAGRSALDDLLQGVYVCEQDQWNANHGAVAALLHSGRCAACITTNFDNALELATGQCQLFDHTCLPLTIEPSQETPVVIKLHGDATSRTCVSTSPALFDADQNKTFVALPHVLKGQTVLVFGYSGFGDIDISRHLNNAEARFLWGVPKRDTSVPPAADARVVSDLANLNPAANLLLGLATAVGWAGPAPERDRDWKSYAAAWSSRVVQDPTALEELVLAPLEWRNGWPVVHIRAQKRRAEPYSRYVMLGRACLQIAAYESGAKYLNRAARALSSTGTTLDSRLLWDVRRLVGFALWRQGRLKDALAELWQVVAAAMRDATAKVDPLRGSEAYRLYLEVARDFIECTPHHRRRGAFNALRLAEVIEAARDLKTSGPANDSLLSIVIWDIYRLVGIEIDLDVVRSEYDRCMNSRYFAAAECAARILLSANFAGGIWAQWNVVRELQGLAMWNHIANSVVRLMGVLLGPLDFIVAKLAYGRWGLGLKTMVTERRLRRQRMNWLRLERSGR